MSNHLQLGVLFLATVSLLPGTGQMALATPEQSFGMSCVVCHGTPRDALRVNGDAEALPTFTVEAGETAQLSFDVYREEGVFEEFEYILGVRGLDASEFDPSLGADWEYRSGETFSYVLNDEQEIPRTFTLDVAVASSTPAGLYPMEAIVAGHDEYEQETSWSWFSDSWVQSSLGFTDFPKWTSGSFGFSSSEVDGVSETEVFWSDLRPFNLRVTSPAVPEPSTFVLLFTLAIILPQRRIQQCMNKSGLLRAGRN